MGTISPRPFDDRLDDDRTAYVLAKVGETYLVLRPSIEKISDTDTQELYAIYADTNDIREARRILREMNGVDLAAI